MQKWADSCQKNGRFGRWAGLLHCGRPEILQRFRDVPCREEARCHERASVFGISSRDTLCCRRHITISHPPLGSYETPPSWVHADLLLPKDGAAGPQSSRTPARGRHIMFAQLREEGKAGNTVCCT
ncbi:hypothetical protein LIA77_06003 [Sarocladium implicatum]|nr:hypothetical protein LIA77_06003 [Sarocladium implicatum]